MMFTFQENACEEHLLIFLSNYKVTHVSSDDEKEKKKSSVRVNMITSCRCRQVLTGPGSNSFECGYLMMWVV
jgi:hypothetical protein